MPLIISLIFAAIAVTICCRFDDCFDFRFSPFLYFFADCCFRFLRFLFSFIAIAADFSLMLMPPLPLSFTMLLMLSCCRLSRLFHFISSARRRV